MGIGGGPQLPPGGPPGGAPPPPGYPPPLGNPPPPLGNPPPPGNLLLGWLSCGSRMGGNSGSLSGPPLGGSGLSGSCARLKAASSSAVRGSRCPVCGSISPTISHRIYVAPSVIISTGSVIVVIAGGLM